MKKKNVRNERNPWKAIAALFLAATFCGALFGQATYYVDSKDGNDSNNGLSSQTAWKTLLKVNGLYLNPGDKVLLKKGSVFTDYLRLTELNGIADNFITISTYGDGNAKAVINGNVKEPQVNPKTGKGFVVMDVIYTEECNYLRISNIEATGTYRYGIRLVGGSDITIDSCYVHDISVDTDWEGIMLTQSPVNVKILHTEVARVGSDGIYGSSENLEIGYCNIHDIDMTNSTGDNIQLNVHAPNFWVHHNIIDHSNTENKGALVCSDETDNVNGIFEYNTVYGGPNNNFSYSTGGGGCIVRYNHFIGPGSGQAIKGKDILVYGNIFENYSTVFEAAKSNSTYQYYNNIIKNTGNYIVTTESNDPGMVIYFKNNIVIGRPRFRTTSSPTYYRSNNLYTEGETNETNAKIGDPMFVSSTDYHLRPGSPCINAGVAIDEIRYDYDQVPIPQDGAPDIGIYEFTGEVVIIPDPPIDTTNEDTTVVVENVPPIIVVNYKETAFGGYVSTIDASKTYDPNNDNLSFNWTVPSEIPVDSKNKNILSFLAPELNAPQFFDFVINASDGKESSSRTVTILVYPYKPELSEANIYSVEASSYDGSNVPENIIDNDESTRWSAEGDNQWIIFDLHNSMSISHLKINFYSGESRTAFFDIYGSTDDQNWELVMNSLESCGFSGKSQVYDFPSKKATSQYRYLKLVGHGNTENDWNSYTEFKIVKFPGSSVSNINETDDDNQPSFSVYPNPANGMFHVDLNNIYDIAGYSIKLFDFTGRLIYEKLLEQSDEIVSIPDILNGVYLLQFLHNSSVIDNQKLVIK